MIEVPHFELITAAAGLSPELATVARLAPGTHQAALRGYQWVRSRGALLGAVLAVGGRYTLLHDWLRDCRSQ